MEQQKWRKTIYTIFCGLCMGSADIVPGISGGTIAFLMGFYEELLRSIESINHEALLALIQGRWGIASQLIAWPFLVPLLTGIGVAMALLAQLIDTILNHIELRTLLYATFFGMITASVFFCAKQVSVWRKKTIFAFIFGGVLAFVLTGIDNLSHIAIEAENYEVALPASFQPKTMKNQEIVNYDPSAGVLYNITADEVKVLYVQGVLDDNAIIIRSADSKQLFLHEVIQKQARFEWINPWVIFCGALAVCALLLPGISGSYLLQMLGLYSAIIAALADFTSGLVHLSFNVRAAFLLANLALGIALGAALFSHVISWLLNRYRGITIAFLTGCMVGSLRSLWPFYSYQYILEPMHLHRGPRLEATDLIYPGWNEPLLWYGFACGLLAFIAVYAIENVVRKPNDHQMQTNSS